MHPLSLAAKRGQRLLKQVQLLQQSPGIAPVHDVRVACRRLQQSLSTLKDWFGAETRKRVRRAANQIRKTFGEVRDADVTLELLAQWLPSRERTVPEIIALSHLVQQRQQDRVFQANRALTHFASEPMQAHIQVVHNFVESCRDLIARGAPTLELQALPATSPLPEQRTAPQTVPPQTVPPQTAPSQTTPTHNPQQDTIPLSPAKPPLELLVRQIHKPERKIVSMLQEQELDLSPEGLQQAHDVRLVVKNYRYAAEAFAKTLPDKQARKQLLIPFRNAQRALGTVQDTCVLLRLLGQAEQQIEQGPPLPPGSEHLDPREGFAQIVLELLDAISLAYEDFFTAYRETLSALETIQKLATSTA